MPESPTGSPEKQDFNFLEHLRTIFYGKPCLESYYAIIKLLEIAEGPIRGVLIDYIKNHARSKEWASIFARGQRFEKPDQEDFKRVLSIKEIYTADFTEKDAEEMKRKSGIKTLSIGISDAASMKTVVSAIGESNKLEELEVSYSDRVMLQDIEVLLDLLDKSSHVQVLKVKGRYSIKTSWEAIERLANHSGLQRIKKLHLETLNIEPEHVKILTRSPYINCLEELSLKGNKEIGEEGIRTLADCQRLSALKSLDLSYCKLTAKEAEILASSNFLRPKVLNLADNRLGGEGVESIVNSSLVNNVAELNLNGDEKFFRPETLRSIATSSQLRVLRQLRISGTHLGSDELDALLVDSDVIRNLKELDIGYCSLGDSGAEKIANAPCLAKIETLGVNRNRIGLRGTTAIITSRTLTNLRGLNIRTTLKLKTSEVEQLLEIPELSKIENLQLELGDSSSAKALAFSPHISLYTKLMLLRFNRRGQYPNYLKEYIKETYRLPKVKPKNVEIEKTALGIQTLIGEAVNDDQEN